MASTKTRRAPGANADARREAGRLRLIAEGIRARLEARVTADDDAPAARDDAIGLLLKLIQAVERIAALEVDTARANDGPNRATLDETDRAIVERHVAWRLRAHGIDAGIAGLPPPVDPADDARG